MACLLRILTTKKFIMKLYFNKIFFFSTVAVSALLLTSCDKENQNNLPGVNPADYAGTIDGFKSSNEIYPKNLVAFWDFNMNTNEQKSGSAPTEMKNAVLADGGITGKKLNLTQGYLYFAKQFSAFKTDSLKSFTISTWIQIQNNNSKKTMLLTIARPGLFLGALDFILETNRNPASVTDYIFLNPAFTAVAGGRQNNVNAFGASNTSPMIGATTWTNFVITYDFGSGTFNIWGNGVKIGNYPNRGTGNSSFKSYEPNEFIIGATYNQIPGKSVNGDTSFEAMTGSIDDIRIYNTALPDAFISALYKLGAAGK